MHLKPKFRKQFVRASKPVSANQKRPGGSTGI
jgi:hypothetical protein